MSLFQILFSKKSSSCCDIKFEEVKNEEKCCEGEQEGNREREDS
ncbi:hypothetical protein [Ammoniphilus sp. CFH 90114]|nr:hypothetical protein [Ammoniphilus sp. CFH 90114]